MAIKLYQQFSIKQYKKVAWSMLTYISTNTALEVSA